jgi:hypothetical protein
MRTSAAVVMLCFVAACDHQEPEGYLVYPQGGGPRGAVTVVVAEPPVTTARADAARIQVLPEKRADRPAEVVGVVDAHVPQGDEAAALAVLRQKAADLGADAVIGVDLEHGEGHKGEPIHLSGLAIRYLERPVARTEGSP